MVVTLWMCCAHWHTNSHTHINNRPLAFPTTVETLAASLKTKPMLVPASSCDTLQMHTQNTLHNLAYKKVQATFPPTPKRTIHAL